jgi:metal-responsive CopG/Arc/MetJ family transcriptional regulator
MSRPRSRDKCIPITIALPTSLAMKLENALSYSQSRSTWVANAIENKILDIKHNPVDDRTTRQLIAQLSMRPDIDESLRLILKTHLK